MKRLLVAPLAIWMLCGCSKPVETSYVEAVQRRTQALCDCRKQTEVRQGGDPEFYKAVAGAKACVDAIKQTPEPKLQHPTDDYKAGEVDATERVAIAGLTCAEEVTTLHTRLSRAPNWPSGK